MNNSVSDKPVVKELIDLCHQYGIEEVIISPGSRNAPLILSFHGSHLFNCLTIVDERSAGYFALGLARTRQKPVAIICTSGTAAVNFAPAVAEAFYQQIPLVVITADRPTEWINQADGQAINQQGIYSNYIRHQCQLPVSINHADDAWFVNRTINEALLAATGINPGPVHINVPLREPLYGKTVFPANPARKIISFQSNQTLANEDLQMLLDEIHRCDRVMVLMGAHHKDHQLHAALSLLADKGIMVLTETLSNTSNGHFINNMDRVVSTIPEDDYPIFAPDLLITFDVPVLSKMIKKMLRTRKPKSHWHFSNRHALTDTYQSLTRKIGGNAGLTIHQIAENIIPKSRRFTETWKKRAEEALNLHHQYLNRIGWCDLKLFQTLNATSFHDYQIHLGNSTPVRYAQLFDWDNSHTWFANRGTSGIDGCVSTAAGAAYGSEQPVLLIVGDLSFFYDSNGLWHKYLKPNFRIILINNSGGGIFRFLPGSSETEELEQFFEVKQNLNAQGIAQTFGLKYMSCNNELEFNNALETFFSPSEKPIILEVFTPNVENGVLLKNYFKYLNRNS